MNGNAALIIIDLWETSDSNKNIVDKLADNICDLEIENLSVVFLANYKTDVYETNLYKSTFEYHNNKKLKEKSKSWCFLNQGIEHLSKKETHHKILQKDFNVPQYIAYTKEEFDYYTQNVDTSIKQIYIVGMEWNQCVKGRLLGYSRFKRSEYQIYTNPKCILSLDNNTKLLNFMDMDKIDFLEKVEESKYKFIKEKIPDLYNPEEDD